MSEQFIGLFGPSGVLWRSCSVNSIGHVPEMFSCMVEIHNLHRIGEVVLNDMANPAGSVPQEHDFSCSVHSTALGKRIKKATKLFYSEPSCHILNRSRSIQNDPWYQFLTFTTGGAFKNLPHFALAIHIRS